MGGSKDEQQDRGLFSNLMHGVAGGGGGHGYPYPPQQGYYPPPPTAYPPPPPAGYGGGYGYPPAGYPGSSAPFQHGTRLVLVPVRFCCELVMIIYSRLIGIVILFLFGSIRRLDR